MESAHFSYSRTFAIGQYVVLPLLIIPFFTLGLASLYFLTRAEDLEDVVTLLMTLAAVTWVIVILWQWVRYRHAVGQRYTLDFRGVLVESPEGTKQISWVDFESAECLRLVGMLRLRSARLEKPIFLFLDHGLNKRRDIERNKTAMKLVETHLHDRYIKRWVL